MNCRFEAKENEPRVRALGWCYEHKIACGYQPQRDAVKIRARNGEIIDLSDIRKENVFVGNPYAVDMAIIIKHNTALLDALEAALGVLKHRGPKRDNKLDYDDGRNDGINEIRRAIGVIEEPT